MDLLDLQDLPVALVAPGLLARSERRVQRVLRARRAKQARQEKLGQKGQPAQQAHRVGTAGSLPSGTSTPPQEWPTPEVATSGSTTP